MIERFVAPEPNCGHVGSTFTWIGMAHLWMCALCIASIGPLYTQRCSHCGRAPHNNEQLVDVFRAGRLCRGCRLNHLRGRRAS